MSMFRRAATMIRCAFGRDCPVDMETHNTEVAHLREQEIAATTAIAEIRSRREAMDRSSETIEQMMAALVASNRRAGRSR